MATNKDKLIAGAQKLVEKGQFEKAIKEYLKVVAEDDKDVRIWLKIGDLYAKLNKKPEAAETYQRVAQFYSDQGFYLKSVAVYKQILKIEPRLVDVNHRLAELYKQLGLLSDAMQQYEAVVAFYQREGKTREALNALKQIVELDPETVANRIKLAELYSKEGMVREAIDEFTKAAEQLRQAGRVDDFMKVAERLLFHSPDNRPIAKELAGLYIEKGDPRRALPKLQVCFKADPRDTDVLGLLAKAFESLDQRAKAVSVLKEQARILGENGDNRGRDATWRKILQLVPSDPDAEAALSGAGRVPETEEPRARRPSGARPAVTINDSQRLANNPVQRAMLDYIGARPEESAPRPANPTGGRPVVIAGRTSFDDNEPPPDEFDGPSRAHGVAADGAPRSPIADGPTRGFADESDGGGTAANSEEEIAKILSETDVYIKYNLHAKAVEHLQRAFERNPRHIEAREKLKALYLILGRKDEAVLELWSLVENVEPGRQRRYLREILEIDPSNARAAGMLGEAPSAAGPLDSAPLRRDARSSSELLDVEDLEELPDEEFDVAEPSGVRADPALEDDDDMLPVHFDDQSSEEGISEPDDELIPVVVETLRGGTSSDEHHVEDRFGFADPEPSAPAVEDRFSFDEEPASDESSVPMPRVVEDRLRDEDDQLLSSSSDEDGADRFGFADGPAPAPEIAPARSRPPVQLHRPDFESESDVHTRFDENASRFASAASFDDSSEVSDDALPSLPPSRSTQPAREPAPPQQAERNGTGRGPERNGERNGGAAADLHASITRNSPPPAELLAVDDSVPRAVESVLEDDLDEADFFVQQALFDEARVILNNLLKRSPGHPLVSAKLRDLEALERAASTDPAPVERRPERSSEVPTAVPGREPTDPSAGFELARKGVIEKGVNAEDFETHYDLGIAYKEMGLLDDAISEFRIVMKDPAREVQCHLMIGLCFLEKGQQTEAIAQFKKGLYVEGITDREALSLYFELGQAYERLKDPREALYYYEKVIKRDSRFRDVEKRVETLRAGDTAAQPVQPAAPGDDLDAAFDSLLGKDA